MTEPNLEDLREQLEDFAISLKPGTTKGKHRTAIFDTVVLAELVQALIANQVREARIDEIKFFAGEGLDYIDASRQELLDRIKELGEDK